MIIVPNGNIPTKIGNVGAVFCLEASRLARNGRDWQTLLKFFVAS
jgi:hypothetical protein